MSQFSGLPVLMAKAHEVDQLEFHVAAQLSGRVRRLPLYLVNAGLILRGSARTYHAK